MASWDAVYSMDADLDRLRDARSSDGSKWLKAVEEVIRACNDLPCPTRPHEGVLVGVELWKLRAVRAALAALKGVG